MCAQKDPFSFKDVHQNDICIVIGPRQVPDVGIACMTNCVYIYYSIYTQLCVRTVMCMIMCVMYTLRTLRYVHITYDCAYVTYTLYILKGAF